MENIRKRFKEGIILESGQKLILEKLEGKRIYNPTAPFKIGNEIYLACRVEDKLSGESEVRLFQKNRDKWVLVKDAPVFNLEDPFIAQLSNGILFGGVYVEWENRKVKFLRTIFYYGQNYFSLNPQTPFAQGPLMMKDIRIVQLENKIGVFTRPQGGKYLKGRICYLEVETLDDLKKEEIYQQGELIDLPIQDEEWVGSNGIHYLDEKNLGVLGHLAFKDKDDNLHYSAITFIFNRKNFKVNDFKIVAQRKNFPPGSYKNENLKDVVFPGGLLLTDDRNYILYCGLSDEEIGCLKIKNPFEL
jgi:hypothetical protein